MNSKTIFSKTTSVVASIVLALGGSLVATQPATAAPANSVAPAVTGNASVGQVLTTSDGTWTDDVGAPPGMVFYKWIRCSSSISSQLKIGANLPVGCESISRYVRTYTLVSADLGKYIASEISYQGSGTTVVFSATTSAVAAAAATYTVTLDANGGTNGTTTTLTQGSSGAAVTLPTTTGAPTKTNCTLSGWAISNQNADASSPTLVSNTYTPSSNVTLFASWSCTSGSNNQQSTEQVTRSVERSIPTSVFQAPILNSLAPKLTSGFSSNGGRLVMKDVKPADIASVMLNGKKVEVVASKSGAALRIPAGAGAGDLTFTMADGTVISVANAVKITTSAVDAAAVPLDSLPKFSGTSVAVPKAVLSVITKAKALILDSESAKCVGYASSNTAASKAVALARATNVCGVINDINENIEPIVKVLVNKTVAKKSPVRYLTW